MPSSDQSKYEKMTLFQLICEYWEFCEYYEDMIHGFNPYYWRAMVNKSRIMKFLREKWPKCLPSFISVLLKKDELDQG